MVDWSFIDIINVLSFVVGVQNLELNERQIKSLDNHLRAQDENQLALIIKQNEEIIKLLKEKK